MEERTVKIIVEQMKLVRTGQASIASWSLEDVLSDIELVSGEILAESLKVRKGNKAAARRVRSYLKTLETLGLEFRKKSI